MDQSTGMNDELGPLARGLRIGYDALPVAVRTWVEDALGEPVVETITQPGGFSPGVAARLRGTGGRRAFLKAVSSEANPETPAMHRREAHITAALPSSVPAPALLASYDDGTWVALLLEDIDGRHPTLPWRPDELSQVVAALDELHAALTPSPIADVAEAAQEHADLFGNWQVLADSPLPGLDPWAVRNLAQLADVDAGWAQALTGDTLLHFDVRADNILLTEDRAWFVDWPSAARGAAVFDLVSLAPSVEMQGGPAPQTLLGMSRVGREADPEVVLTLAVAAAGYFCHRSLMPAPPGLPTVRVFQAAQGAVALRWLREMTGWP